MHSKKRNIQAVASCSTAQAQELMMLMNSGAGPELSEILTQARRSRARQLHTRKIYQLSKASGYKKGKWKTYVYIEGRRKEIIRQTEEEVLDWLYDFYVYQKTKQNTLQVVFEEYMNYKEEVLARSAQTIHEDIRHFCLVDETLRNKQISEVTEEDIRRSLVADYLPRRPRESAFVRVIRILHQTFEFAVRKRLCPDNPVRFISARDYLKDCDRSRKSDEEKAFSEEELNKITEDALREPSNPRALMTLLAKETGLRAGELTVIHKSDIGEEFIHIHRQQRKETGADGHQLLTELPYTKDERFHAHNGRYIPITKEIRRIIEDAVALPGESVYLFHDHGRMITKDSYMRNLKRRCQRLNITTHNNHAFRMAFNTRLIRLGLDASERASLLGHDVQTNENVYSLKDSRRREEIRRKLIESPAAL